jgi:hypothetical protein
MGSDQRRVRALQYRPIGQPWLIGAGWQWERNGSTSLITLDVVYGESRNRGAAQALALAAQLRSVVTNGTVYLAYPVLATADERVEVDALLVSREHGLVAFLLTKDMPTDDNWDVASSGCLHDRVAWPGTRTNRRPS